MFKTILYATDLGPYSTQILQHVMGMAAQHEARVVVLHAVEPIFVAGDASANDSVVTFLRHSDKCLHESRRILPVVQGVREKVMELLEDEFIDGNLDADVVRKVVVEAGEPTDIILTQARKEHADLLVLGSHGGFSMQANELGSVSSSVMQQSAIPVYLVPLMKSARHQQYA